MSLKYSHLGCEERIRIETLKAEGLSVRQITDRLDRSASTISRELKRNMGKEGYRHDLAQEMAENRRRDAASVRKMTADLRAVISAMLTNYQFSPEQIAGRLKYEQTASISATSIYRYIRRDRGQGGELYRHLRHGGRKYNRRVKGQAGRGMIVNRVDTAQRPAVVDEKSRFGDRELDTIAGGEHRGAVVTMVERGSKFSLLQGVKRRTAKEVSAAMKRKLESWKDLCPTMTSDNGREFSDHEEVSKAPEAEFYFTTPYHSWERGLNEHSNGLIRQYRPEGTDLSRLSKSEVKRVEDLLNHRPRKVPGFRKPYEVIHGAPERGESPIEERVGT